MLKVLRSARQTACIAAFAAACVMIQASPSKAEEPCTLLAAALFAHGWTGAENPSKPKNVSMGGVNDIHVSWDIPSSRPAGTASGWCINLEHIETGGSKDWCKDEADATEAYISNWNCLSSNHCPAGDYNVKVKLKNNCDLVEYWSDSVVGENKKGVH